MSLIKTLSKVHEKKVPDALELLVKQERLYLVTRPVKSNAVQTYFLEKDKEKAAMLEADVIAKIVPSVAEQIRSILHKLPMTNGVTSNQIYAKVTTVWGEQGKKEALKSLVEAGDLLQESLTLESVYGKWTLPAMYFSANEEGKAGAALYRSMKVAAKIESPLEINQHHASEPNRRPELQPGPEALEDGKLVFADQRYAGSHGRG